MSKPTKSIIFNKFKIKNLICSTHFGKVYSGINVKNKEPIAIEAYNFTDNWGSFCINSHNFLIMLSNNSLLL